MKAHTVLIPYNNNIMITGLTVADAAGFAVACSGVTDFAIGDAGLSAAEVCVFGDYTMHN